MAGKFVLKKDAGGQFRFNLLASNGQVIASSEAYTTKAAALNGIDSVKPRHGRRYRRPDRLTGGRRPTTCEFVIPRGVHRTPRTPSHTPRTLQHARSAYVSPRPERWAPAAVPAGRRAPGPSSAGRAAEVTPAERIASSRLSAGAAGTP